MVIITIVHNTKVLPSLYQAGTLRNASTNQYKLSSVTTLPLNVIIKIISELLNLITLLGIRIKYQFLKTNIKH